jgi:3-oxoadipate enol-lactonase
MLPVVLAMQLLWSTTPAPPVSTMLPPPASLDAVDYSFAAERDIIVDGVRLRLLEVGPEAGQRVLLLHCFGLSSQVWREVMPALAAAGYRVAAYDAFGHGKSERPTRRLKLDRLSDAAIAVLDTLGWSEATLVGSSMGGATALTVAIDAPARVSHLVLVDAAGLDLRAWFGPAWQALDSRHAARAPDWAWGIAYDLAVEKAHPLSVRVRRELLSTRADPQQARAAFNFKTIVDDLLVVDRTPGLSRVTARTLVVTGAHDRLVHPDHAKRLAAGIPGAQLVVWDDLGHLPQVEDPARLAAEIVRVLASTTTTTKKKKKTTTP